jgi:hypothetical protein
MLVTWEHRVLLFSILCQGILLWRLWSEKLARLYLFLTLYLAGGMLQDIAFLPLRRNSNAYARSFFLSTPVLWVLAYLVVLELYRLILEDYPGIASVGRKAVTYSMALAVIISAAYAIPDLLTPAVQYPLLRLFYLVERSTVLGLLLFLTIIPLFLFRYRLGLSRNRIIYAMGYALYFGVGVAQDIVITALGFRVGGVVSLWMVAAAGVVLLGGAALLNSEGEVRVQAVVPDEDVDRAHLQHQLAEMNRMLSRAARGRG